MIMKKPYDYKIVEDCKFPEELNSACIQEALNFVPRDGDIGVVTYPRSGTTWTQQIVLHLLRHGDFNGSWNDLSSKSPCLELQGTKAVLKSPNPVFYKTHIPLSPKRWNPKSKYIWVVRNPRDVCVSSYHLYTDLHQVPWTKKYSFDKFAQHFCNGETYYGCYWDHLRSWWAVKEEPNVLMLVYEEMKRDPKGTIVRIGEFIGGASAELVNDPEVVDDLIHQTTVKATKRKANTGFVRNLLKFNKLDISIPKEVFRPRHAIWKILGGEVNFVRKGVVGDWKNHFTPAIEEQFEEWTKAQSDYEEVVKLFE